MKLTPQELACVEALIAQANICVSMQQPLDQKLTCYADLVRRRRLRLGKSGE